MLLFLAQNHSPMTHLPIATSILAAMAALAALLIHRKEITWSWAVLSIAACLTVFPTLVTGIAAAKGRHNESGKPYIQIGVIVDHVPENTRLFDHQMLGISGSVIAAILAMLGIARLRGRNPHPLIIALLSVLLAILWGIGGYLGGRELWGPDTFPGFH